MRQQFKEEKIQMRENTLEGMTDDEKNVRGGESM